MRGFLLRLMGVNENQKPLQERCAWRYRVEELLVNDLTIPERHAKCEYCNGFPEQNCPNYTTLTHMENFYDMFHARRTT